MNNITNVVLDRNQGVVTYETSTESGKSCYVYFNEDATSWVCRNPVAFYEEIDKALSLEPQHAQYDVTLAEQVKQPRYLKEDGTDTIDKWAATRSHEVFREIMWAMMEKYKDRLGKKDPIPQEVGKMADYMNRWLEYEKIWDKE